MMLQELAEARGHRCVVLAHMANAAQLECVRHDALVPHHHHRRAARQQLGIGIGCAQLQPALQVTLGGLLRQPYSIDTVLAGAMALESAIAPELASESTFLADLAEWKQALRLRLQALPGPLSEQQRLQVVCQVGFPARDAR